MKKFISVRKLTALVVIVFCLHISVFSQSPEKRKEVSTLYGVLSGKQSAVSDVFAFKGIPFAQPPVGDLRWKSPVPPTAWDGIRFADQFGPSPMQEKPVAFMVYTPEFLIPSEPISEDCLYLNVWSGAKSAQEKRPVLVWIYGGGFVSGGSGCDIYDGEALAKKGIIFVSINYRVGIFGFFSHPELTNESPHHSSGNYGLLDQIAALQWIQKNIAAFGGDPGNVTIAGQSAGSFSVCSLVASPLAKGLFHKAIAESGSSVVGNPIFPADDLKKAEAQGVKIAETVNAPTLSALRKVSPEVLLKQSRAGIRPIVDGYVLPAAVHELFRQGKFADIPLLTGWNADEAFVAGFKNKENFQQEAVKVYGKDAVRFLKYYPANSDEEAMASQIALSRDQIFGLSNYKWAGIQSSKGKSKAFVYYFTRKPPATGDYIKYGAFHTAEVPYALNNLKFFKRTFEPVDEQLSETMSGYWVNFIKTGNPNGKGLPEWPVFTTQKSEVMILSEKPGAAVLPGKGGLDFLYESMQKK